MSVTARAGSLILACALGVAATPAGARALWTSGERSLALRTSAKSSTVLSRSPRDPILFPERTGGESLWRLRFDLEARPGPVMTANLAYEHRLRLVSHGAGPAPSAGILPAEAPAPYRLRQLDRPIAESARVSWRHELDRLSLAFHPRRAEVTLGRQAVGWGRGVMFGAVDLFSPFAPLEADREWRRGVDAVRADLGLADRVSLDLVAAGGERVEQSAFAGRLRGYAGRADAELILGRRARDLVAGASTSAAAGEAEVHGEVAVFHTPEPVPDGGRDVIKAVVGGSHRFPLGKGLPVFAEYHYSGFGVSEPRDALARLAEPAFQARYLRGDSQILGRHAVALLATYEHSEELETGATLLVSPREGSGVLSPSATLHLGDRLTLRAIAYVPFGAAPRAGVLRSFYGAVPYSGFVQIDFYD